MKRFLLNALRVFAYLLAIFIVLVVIIYIEEDWRGARAWAAYQRELAAQGESLDLHTLVPPGKPEDDLSKVPIFAELYEYEKTRNDDKESSVTPRIQDLKRELRPMSPHTGAPQGSSYLAGQPLDLFLWQKYYRSLPEAHLPQEMGKPAQDVLQTLSQFGPDLKEIDTAVSNSKGYWPVDYDAPFQTSLAAIGKMIQITQVLQLQGIAHLDNQQPDFALNDYLACMRLNRSLVNDHSFVGYLIAGGVTSTANAILWEGLHRHTWTASQLNEMEAALASIDMLDFAAKALRTERASTLKTMTLLSADSSYLRHKETTFDAITYFAIMTPFRPLGWWDEDKVLYCENMQTRIDAIHPKDGLIDTEAFPAHDSSPGDELEFDDTSVWRKLYTPMSAFSLPIDDYFGPSIAKVETYRRLARVACRLEEYRLTHGAYPAKLDDLPDLQPHLNQEVVSIHPFHYLLKGNSYELYSLGWSQIDGGGKSATDKRKGNWPWPSP